MIAMTAALAFNPGRLETTRKALVTLDFLVRSRTLPKVPVSG